MAPNADDTCRQIARYLQKKLGVPTEFVDGVPWSERERLFDAGEIHLCWLCGLPYVWKADGDGDASAIELLTAPVMAGTRYCDQPVYFSDIVVGKSSRFENFADLRGASWAYNEPNSHSGHNVVRHHLYGLGETSGYFGLAVESGAHQISLRMIVDGMVDASAIDSTVLEIELEHVPSLRGQIRVIDTLGPSPMPPWVMRGDLPDDLKRGLREVFLGMAGDADGAAILHAWGIARFSVVDDRVYDPIRKMVRNAEHVRLSIQA